MSDSAVFGQTLQWGGQFPSVAPLPGATDTPTAVAATKTNVYVAGSVQLPQGQYLGIAQYNVPPGSGMLAQQRSALYYTNSADADIEPIVVDGMAICTFPGVVNNAEVQGTRVYVISHSPNFRGHQRVLVTAFITSDLDTDPPEKYGRLTLNWSVYLDGLPKTTLDEVPVAIAINDTVDPGGFPLTPVVAVAIKSTVQHGTMGRVVVFRGTDGKQLFDADSSVSSTPSDVPVGVAIRGDLEGAPLQVYLGGTTYSAPAASGPRIFAMGWDVLSANPLGGPAYVNVADCTAVCMSAFRRATEPQGMQYDGIFAIAGYTTPPNNVVVAKDILTTCFAYNPVTAQIEQTIEARWGQTDFQGNPISEDVPVSIAMGASQATDQTQHGPIVVVTGTSKIQGQPQQTITLSYYVFTTLGGGIVHPPLRWYALFDNVLNNQGHDSYPTSVMLDGDSADSYNAYVSGAAVTLAGDTNFVTLKYAANCSLGWGCGPQFPSRGLSFATGLPQYWPTGAWANYGNDVAVSTSAQDVVYPGATGRWFYTVGPSPRGATGIDWQTLGYQE